MDACTSAAASARISDSSDATLTSWTSWRCAVPEGGAAPCEFQIRSSKKQPDVTPSSSPTSKSHIPASQVEMLSHFKCPLESLFV